MPVCPIARLPDGRFARLPDGKFARSPVRPFARFHVGNVAIHSILPLPPSTTIPRTSLIIFLPLHRIAWIEFSQGECMRRWLGRLNQNTFNLL
jgi:hypothetical protein